MCNALLSKCDNDLRPYLVLKALLMSFPFFGEGGGGGGKNCAFQWGVQLIVSTAAIVRNFHNK